MNVSLVISSPTSSPQRSSSYTVSLRLTRTAAHAASCTVQYRVYYFAPPPPPGRDGKYCDQHVSISACPLAYLKTHVQTSRNFLRTLPVTVFRSDDNAIRYVLPVLRMTSCFHNVTFLAFGVVTGY